MLRFMPRRRSQGENIFPRELNKTECVKQTAFFVVYFLYSHILIYSSFPPSTAPVQASKQFSQPPSQMIHLCPLRFLTASEHIQLEQIRCPHSDPSNPKAWWRNPFLTRSPPSLIFFVSAFNPRGVLELELRCIHPCAHCQSSDFAESLRLS